jgi:hypothetical protein
MLRRTSMQVSEMAQLRTSDTSILVLPGLNVRVRILVLISSGTQKTIDCPMPNFLILMHAARKSMAIIIADLQIYPEPICPWLYLPLE